jgi:molecular chaperone DnaK
MRVLGIDFGTSNTAAMLRLPDGRMRPLLFDGSPLLPSAVYLNPDNRMLVGRDAERNARLDPARFEPNPKRRVDDGQILLGDKALSVPEAFAAVLGQVATEAHRQLGAPADEVRVTHPARWGERRRALLIEAARIAGLGAPRLIPEPVAAASYFTAMLGTVVPVGRSLAIYDLGGGTFDATVVRRTHTGFDVLAEEGLPDVGGLDFDHAVVEHLGNTHRRSHPQSWNRLINPVDAGDRRCRRMLYDDVRGAKEMLSRTGSTDIHLPALEVDAHLTRGEFEQLVRPYLERTVDCLRRVVADARVPVPELVGVFMVGGSSRIPLAAHLIHTGLGVAATTLEQPETVVVEGALCIGASARPGPHTPPPAPQPPPQPVIAQPAPTAFERRPVPPSPLNLTKQPTPNVARQPVSLNRPPAGPPQPMPVRPMPGQPIQPLSAAQPPPRAQPRQAARPSQPGPPAPATRTRAWYGEPVVLGTIGVLVLVAIAFVILLRSAFGG